jgi:hypothetical protein
MYCFLSLQHQHTLSHISLTMLLVRRARAAATATVLARQRIISIGTTRLLNHQYHNTQGVTTTTRSTANSPLPPTSNHSPAWTSHKPLPSNTVYESFAKEACKIVGATNVIRDPLLRLAYGSDASFYRLVPRLGLSSNPYTHTLSLSVQYPLGYGHCQ